jgi:hypothetical protein
MVHIVQKSCSCILSLQKCKNCSKIFKFRKFCPSSVASTLIPLADITYIKEVVFSEVASVVDFVDIIVKLVKGKICVLPFEKHLNLYLYIPPTSAHPPGNLLSLIYGRIVHFQIPEILFKQRGLHHDCLCKCDIH